MSRRKERRRPKLGVLWRLLPLYRPYLGWMVVLVGVTLSYSAADAGRAYLVEPFFNRVLLRSGEVRGQVEDEALAASLGYAGEVEEALGGVEGVEVGVLQERLRVEVGLEGELGEVGEALERTERLWERTAVETPLSEAGAWASLGWAAGALEEAGRRLREGGEGSEAVALGLGLAARERLYAASFEAAWGALVWVFWVSLGLALALAVTHYLMFYLARTLVARIYVDLQNRVADHLLRLSVRYVESGSRGDLLSRLTADLQLTSSALASLSGDLLIQAIRLLILVGSAVWVSWQLSLSLGVLGLTVLGPLRWWGRKIRRSARRRQGAAGNVLEVMQQIFSGIREVKGFQREAFELDRFRVRTQEATEAQEKAVRARTAAKTWMQLINDMTVPLLFGLGGVLVVRHMWGIDAGQFGAFLGLVLLMYLPTKALGVAYNQFNDALPAVERVFQVLDAEPEVRDDGSAVLEEVREAVELDGVTFGYDPERPILRDVRVRLERGTTTAVVGKTGSGKSTLLGLIARYFDPQQGRVAVDGRDLREFSLEGYLAKVAVVPQTPFLFNDTVAENIRYGKLDATPEEIEEAARRARLEGELGEGVAQGAGEGGEKLAGGQRQRVAIARAIVRAPEILLLDEPTSSLDTRTERLVQAALDEAARGRTMLVVAHRLSTVRRADQIVVLDEGRVVEQGTHDALLARGGVYSRLVAEQLEGGTGGDGGT